MQNLYLMTPCVRSQSVSCALLLSILLVWGIPLTSHAKTQGCRALYGQKKYRQAGACFEQALKAKRKEKASKVRSLAEDRFLRNAALSYARAAKEEEDPTEQAILRERAANLLMESFNSGTCRVSGRCTSNRALAERLLKQIKAAPLNVITGDDNARIRVTGRKYRKLGLGNFSEKVRPGTYKVWIQFSSGKQRTETVTIQPDIGQTLNVSPDKIKRFEKRVVVANQIPPLAIAGYVVGSLTVAGAIALFIGNEVDFRPIHRTYYNVGCLPSPIPTDQAELEAALQQVRDEDGYDCVQKPNSSKPNVYYKYADVPARVDTKYDNDPIFLDRQAAYVTRNVIAIVIGATGAAIIVAAVIIQFTSKSSTQTSVRTLPQLSTLPIPQPLARSRSTKASLLLPRQHLP